MKIYFCCGDFKAEEQDVTQIAAKITRLECGESIAGIVDSVRGY